MQKELRPEELRIGNFVSLFSEIKNGEIHVPLTKPRLIRVLSGEHDSWSIPLTEEWLVKFGFKNSDEDPEYFYHKDFNRIYVRFVSYNFILGNKLGDIVPVDCVHRLQNLYFALTGEELKLTEDTTL